MFKKAIILIVCMSMFLTSSGCGLSKEAITHLLNPDEADYIIAEENGKLTLYNMGRTELATLVLDDGKGKNSFMYYKSPASNTYYAYNITNNKVYVISYKDKELKKEKEFSVDKGDYSLLRGYENKIYLAQNLRPNVQKAEKYTVKKDKKNQLNGRIGEAPRSLPEGNEQSLVTFITEIDAKTQKEMTIKLPYQIDDFIVHENRLFFFAGKYMGEYLLDTHELGVYTIGDETEAAQYVPGINERIYVLNKFGSDLGKSLLFELNPNSLEVLKLRSILKPNPLAITVDRGRHIYLLFRRTEGDNYYSNVLVMDYYTKEKLADIPLSYVPTELHAHNGNLYAVNPYEDYFILIKGAGKPQEVKKPQNSRILLVDTQEVREEKFEEKLTLEELDAEQKALLKQNKVKIEEEKEPKRGYYDEHGQYHEPKEEQNE